ncbi:unnamed protein product, partial [Timema podura]|nr:unnamed protein product [Timema podura]
NGQTALSIAQKLGYITVVETLKVVTEMTITTTTTTTLEEKYRVVAPESMQETFMSDSEDEGGEVNPNLRGGRVENHFGKKNPVHLTEIRTSISPSSAIDLNTTSALANYATDGGSDTITLVAIGNVVIGRQGLSPFICLLNLPAPPHTAGGDEMLDMAMNVYGKPTHAQHVYLPYYQGQMQYT